MRVSACVERRDSETKQNKKQNKIQKNTKIRWEAINSSRAKNLLAVSWWITRKENNRKFGHSLCNSSSVILSIARSQDVFFWDSSATDVGRIHEYSYATPACSDTKPQVLGISPYMQRTFRIEFWVSCHGTDVDSNPQNLSGQLIQNLHEFGWRFNITPDETVGNILHLQGNPKSC
jgi:hypothetical protein